MDRLKRIFAALAQSKTGKTLRDKSLCCLLILYTRSWHRAGYGRFLKFLIALFSRYEQVVLKLLLENKPLTISLRKNNGPDYQMAMTVILLGEYRFPESESPKVIIDAGANIGAFSMFAHVRFPQAKLVCYEPDQANFWQLKLNLESNGINADIYNDAVWHENTTLWFHPGESHKGFVSGDASGIQVTCLKPNLDRFTWLKMDIEGGEFDVLPKLISEPHKLAKYIFLEVHWGKNIDRSKNQAFLDAIEHSSYSLDSPVDFDIFSQSVLLTLQENKKGLEINCGLR